MPQPACNHFLGLRPTTDTADRLTIISDRLQTWELPGRWAHPDDFHLTLVFLGPVDEDEARYLPEALAEVAGSQRRPQHLRLSGLGATGSHGEVPRSIFAAVEDPESLCDAMRRDLCEVLEATPRPDFQPHVTLCRPGPLPHAHPPSRDWRHLLEANGQAEWGAFASGEIVLWRSAVRGVTRYEAVAAWPLL